MVDIYSWGGVFNASLLSLWGGFLSFAPKLVLAVILFIIGWVLGSLVSKAFVQVFGTLKIDKLFQSMGADDLFRKAGMTLNTGYFIGEIMKWFIVIVFLLPSLDLIGLSGIGSFLKDDVLTFLPKIIVAAFVLIIASIISQALSKFITSGSKAMNIHVANMLGTIAKYAVWVFAFIVALNQLGIAESFMNTLFAGIIGMLALGGALAFGLGGKDAAARFIEKVASEARK